MAKDKPPTMTRAAVQESLDRGEHVGTAAGATIKTRREADEHFRPQADAEGKVTEVKEIEAVVVRDENGRLTRAGMERAIKAGGSVLWDGEVITDLDQLPDQAQIDKDAERTRASATSALDQQIATLSAQRARLADMQPGRPPAKAAPNQLAATGHTRAELEAMTVNDLRELADAEQIDLTGAGRKDEIIDAILKHDQA